MATDTLTREDNKIYEVGYLIVPTIPAEKLPAEVTAVKDVLSGSGALVISEEFPKFRPLAYQMRKSLGGRYQKFDRAYFGWVKFEVEPGALDAIKKAFGKNDSIIRFLLISTVRESTLVPPKTFSHRPDGDKREVKIPSHDASAVKSVISEAELDKTIAELIVE